MAPSESDLWPAMTDDRIRAILPIAPCFGQLFGEDGLATITIPTFIIGGTKDASCPYDIDSSYMYEHLGASDRYLVTLEGRAHDGVFAALRLIQQYATAFFGNYLQGKTDFAQYMTPDSAEAFPDVTLQAQLGDS
jgi:predicted dienelactone hydrolase